MSKKRFLTDKPDKVGSAGEKVRVFKTKPEVLALSNTNERRIRSKKEEWAVLCLKARSLSFSFRSDKRLEKRRR